VLLRVLPAQSESGRSRPHWASCSAHPQRPTRPPRAAWRSANWRSRQRERLQDEQAARARLISWRDLAQIPVEHAVSTRPAKTCQWLDDDGCLCNQPSVSRRSGCAAHILGCSLLPRVRRLCQPPSECSLWLVAKPQVP
jgi:hypothetical protein